MYFQFRLSVLTVFTVHCVLQFDLSHWASSKCVWIRLIYSHFCVWLCVRECVYVHKWVQWTTCNMQGPAETEEGQFVPSALLLYKCPISPSPLLFSSPFISLSCDGNSFTHAQSSQLYIRSSWTKKMREMYIKHCTLIIKVFPINWNIKFYYLAKILKVTSTPYPSLKYPESMIPKLNYVLLFQGTL